MPKTCQDCHRALRNRPRKINQTKYPIFKRSHYFHLFPQPPDMRHPPVQPLKQWLIFPFVPLKHPTSASAPKLAAGAAWAMDPAAALCRRPEADWKASGVRGFGRIRRASKPEGTDRTPHLEGRSLGRQLLGGRPWVFFFGDQTSEAG